MRSLRASGARPISVEHAFGVPQQRPRRAGIHSHPVLGADKFAENLKENLVEKFVDNLVKMKLTSLLLLSLVALAASEVYFEEKFDYDKPDGFTKRWTASEHHKEEERGAFVLSHGKFYGDAKADQGLQTSEDARFYAHSAKFDKAFSNKEKELVVQFSVKHEQKIDCGGGYVKIFDCNLDPKDMHGETPYLVMFGPDICGTATKKVHVIFNYDGKNHLIKKDVPAKDDVYTHLYTLIVRPNGKYEVLIDNESVQKGKLEEDWDFLPPRKIKDPEASKPEDWDDREKIDDPEDSKPEDWDKPQYIADPDAVKPDDWDDDMDGEWEPPQIDNPDYQGEWKPKQIANPNYQGKWEHPMIDNPDFDESKVEKLGKFDEICGIGLDLWQVKSGTIFDNIIVTDSVEEAKKFAEETFAKTVEPEKKMKEEQDEEERKKAEADAGDDEDDEGEDELEDDDDAQAKDEL